jgi:putative endonuclease
MKSYFIYILECSDTSFYIGITNDIEQRLQEHQAGIDKSCYTYNKRPLHLCYQEEFSEVEQAILREKQLKKWSRKKKQALINQDFDRLVSLSKKGKDLLVGDLEKK